MFHLGVIPVFLVMLGLLIPANWLESIGVNDHIYHIGAVYIGSIFGIMTLLGMILTSRRLTIKMLGNLVQLLIFSLIFY